MINVTKIDFFQKVTACKNLILEQPLVPYLLPETFS